MKPLPIRLQGIFALGKLTGHVHKIQRISDSADFIRDADFGVLGHTLVNHFVGQQLEQMASDGGGIPDLDEVAVLAVLDLQGDTAGAGCDDGDTLVQTFGDFDFEPFAGGKLEADFGAA